MRKWESCIWHDGNKDVWMEKGQDYKKRQEEECPMPFCLLPPPPPQQILKPTCKKQKHAGLGTHPSHAHAHACALQPRHSLHAHTPIRTVALASHVHMIVHYKPRMYTHTRTCTAAQVLQAHSHVRTPQPRYRTHTNTHSHTHTNITPGLTRTDTHASALH